MSGTMNAALANEIWTIGTLGRGYNKSHVQFSILFLCGRYRHGNVLREKSRLTDTEDSYPQENPHVKCFVRNKKEILLCLQQNLAHPDGHSNTQEPNMNLKKKGQRKRPKKATVLDGSGTRDGCQIKGRPTWSEQNNEQNQSLLFCLMFGFYSHS